MEDRRGIEALPKDGSQQSVTWSLPQVLIRHLEQLASHRGLSPEELAADLLQAAIGDRGPEGSARCSLRIERCSEGPRRLPLLQG